MTLDQLGDLLDRYALNEDLNGALMLIERPDRWYDDPHWRCPNDHVNAVPTQGWRIDIHEKEYSYQLCIECFMPVRLTFPEDVTGPLKEPKAVM